MKAIDIALKDLTRSMRSAILLAFMFGLPLLVSGMFAFMFGSAADEGGFSLPRIKLVVTNLDLNAPRLEGSTRSLPGDVRARTLSELIVKILQSEDMSNLLDVSLAADAETAYSLVDSEQAQVAVIIPENFSRQFADPYDQAVIEFYQDPTLTLGPGIVKSILGRFVDGLSGIKIAVKLALDQLPANDPALVGVVIQRYLDTSLTQRDDIVPLLLEKRNSQKIESETRGSIASILGPVMSGMMIFFAFYTGTATAESILREEEEGTFPRLFTTPTPQATILTGKFLAVFLTVMVQITVLFIAGGLIFRIYWGDPILLSITAFGIVCCASSAGVFINSFLKDTRQGGVVFGGVLTLTGMTGMIRVFSLNASGSDELSNTVSLLVPQGWAIRGILDTMSGAGYNEILLNTLVMLLWSACFFLVGVWRFNRRYI